MAVSKETEALIEVTATRVLDKFWDEKEPLLAERQNAAMLIHEKGCPGRCVGKGFVTVSMAFLVALGGSIWMIFKGIWPKG